MSLKTFHIVFITLAALLAFGFGAWAVQHYRKGEATGLELVLGVISLAMVPALLAYGRYFLRKLKSVSYL